jgi:hypothetical protein
LTAAWRRWQKLEAIEYDVVVVGAGVAEPIAPMPSARKIAPGLRPCTAAGQTSAELAKR